jgi:hypothetical protein
MRRSVIGLSLVAGLLLSFVLLAMVRVRAHDDDDRDGRARLGLQLAPVPLHFSRERREQVGVGSYLVNAVAGCNDCHTCPSYDPGPGGPSTGHNPYGPPFGPVGGGDGKINSKNYLAGGVLFNPPGVTSANLTPDTVSHLPEEGNTFAQFKHLIRTGHDPDEGNRILQVMPWPVFRNMNDDDLRAIYEYLRAIPHAEPGICVAPGQ